MEDSEQSKTEDASAYKLEKAREKGTIARGLDLGVLLVVLALVGYMWIFGAQTLAAIARESARILALAPVLATTSQDMSRWLPGEILIFARRIAPLVGVILIAGFISAVSQAGLNFAPAALKPDFSRLNPANGFKRVFALTTVLETLKAIVKLVTYVTIAALILPQVTHTALGLSQDPRATMLLLGHQALRLLLWYAAAAAVFAVIDQVIVRKQFGDKMRMSRRELRDEVRHREGDPRIRQRRRQLQRELLKRAKSMKSLRGADLLIVNPTHFAVGLKYDSQTMSAPTIVARGAGEFAVRLKRVAFVYRVPIIESPQLARDLFFKGHLDHQIPPNFIRTTAGVYLRAAELKRRRAA